MSKQPPPAPTASTIGPYPTIIQIVGRPWLVGCFGLSGPLRQYFSLYRAVSQREGEREDSIERKNVQTTPHPHLLQARNWPLPYYHPNCRTPRHWKFPQDHRTTQPPHKSAEISRKYDTMTLLFTANYVSFKAMNFKYYIIVKK